MNKDIDHQRSENLNGSAPEHESEHPSSNSARSMHTVFKRLKAVIRAIILYTNRYRIFRWLNGVPYHLAVMILRKRIAGCPEVAALYTRNSFALGHWVPGASDIDLTLVIQSNLQTRREFDFYHRFQKMYATLRRFFPMLGEVEILNAAHLNARTRFDTTHFEPNQWKLLFGKNLLISPNVENQPKVRFYRLNRAIATYYHMFAPRIATFCTENRPPDLSMRRIALKILRLLDEDISAGLHSKIETGDVLDLLFLTLNRLNKTVKTQLEKSPPNETRLDIAALFDGAARDNVHQRPLQSQQNMDLQSIESIVALNFAPYRTHVLLNLDKCHNRNGRGLAGVLHAFENPLLTAEPVFIYYLSFVNPLEYMLMVQERNLFKGEDPFPLSILPSEHTLRPAVCYYAADMFNHLYSESLWAAPQEEFRDLLYGWFLRTLFYLERGTFEFEYHKLAQHFENRHPEYKSNAGPLDATRNPLARFSLIHLVLDDLSHQMTATDA